MLKVVVQKMRRNIAAEGLVRGKTQVIEGGTNSIVSRLCWRSGFSGKKRCHTYSKPSCLPYITQIMLMGTFQDFIHPLKNCGHFLSETLEQKRESSFKGSQ